MFSLTQLASGAGLDAKQFSFLANCERDESTLCSFASDKFFSVQSPRAGALSAAVDALVMLNVFY